MTKTPSLPAMIESLQRTAAFHREREALHAQQQAHHAQQEKHPEEGRARHAAELAAACRHLEELGEMAERLGQVVEQAGVVPPETQEETLGRRPKLSRAVDHVLGSWPPEVPVTASSLADEVRRRYGAALQRDVDHRAIAPRCAAAGREVSSRRSAPGGRTWRRSTGRQSSGDQAPADSMGSQASEGRPEPMTREALQTPRARWTGPMFLRVLASSMRSPSACHLARHGGGEEPASPFR